MSGSRKRGRKRSYNCRYLSYEAPPKDPEDEPRYIKLPLLKIQVYSDAGGIATTALIDSGATVSFLPREIAKNILALPTVTEDVDVQGAGSTFSCEIVEAKQVVLMKGVGRICYYEDVQMYVPKAPVELPYAILGRDTIFGDFEITFREWDKRFKLKER